MQLFKLCFLLYLRRDNCKYEFAAEIFQNISRNQGNSIIVSSVDNHKMAFNQNRDPALYGSVCFAPSVNMISPLPQFWKKRTNTIITISFR